MDTTARLDKTGLKVLCARCHWPLGRISVYPENSVGDHVMLAQERIGAGELDAYATERRCVLESGWRSNPEGVWLLNRHAQRRFDHARVLASNNNPFRSADEVAKAQQRLRDLSATRNSRPDPRRGSWIFPPLPAQVRCPVCPLVNTLDAAALNVANPPPTR